jgi:putative transposase
MRKSRYTDEQIAFALRQAETHTPVQEVIRKMGIAEQHFITGKGAMVVWGLLKCAV